MNTLSELVQADPLGVLSSTRTVVVASRFVTIRRERITALAEELASETALLQSGWNDDLHFRDGTWKSAGWVLALDALNFCFWGPSANPRYRWRVEYRGELYDGYWALVAALRRPVDEGKALWEPTYLTSLTPRDVAHILRPHDEREAEIPMLPMRVHNLHALGRGLIEGFPDRNPVTAFVESCEGSAVTLVHNAASMFPSFDDVTTYDGAPVRFYKRAQILAADIHGAFSGDGLGSFYDLDQLTAFADYKVPQVLRRNGVLEYSPALSARIEHYDPIPMGSAEEVEIRAATVWACELLRRDLAEHGVAMTSQEIDAALWQAGQTSNAADSPYHRTYTIFY